MTKIFSLVLIGIFALPSVALGDAIVSETPPLPCGLVLAGEGRTMATTVMAQSKFSSFDNLTMLDSLGSITAIKDMDNLSRGRLILSTTRGHVVMFSPDNSFTSTSRWIYTPFGVSADILALRPAIANHNVKRAIVYTWGSATVVNQPDWLLPLSTETHGVLDANFILKNRAVVVSTKDYRVYKLPKMKGESATLESDVPSQTNFSAAVVDSVLGRIVAVEGQDIVAITVSGEPEELGQRKIVAHVAQGSDPVEKIVLSNLGTHFYIRQGHRLTFYDFNGNNYGTIDVGGPLMSMEWDSSEKYFAFSSLSMTGVYNLQTHEITTIGNHGHSWRRVAWSRQDRLLLTLGLNENQSHWSVDIWDPVTGKKITEAARYPLMSDKEPYPYLAGLRGSLARSDFQFYVVHANGEYSNVAQSLDLNKGRPKSNIIAIPTVEETRRVLN